MNWNRDGRKKELWEQNKSWIERKAINMRLAIMKMQRQTHGMGLLIIVLIFAMFIYLGVNTYVTMTANKIDTSEEDRLAKLSTCILNNGGCIWSA